MSRKKSSSSLHTIFNSAGGKLCAAITLYVYLLINDRRVSHHYCHRYCHRHRVIRRQMSHLNMMSLTSSCHRVSLSPKSMTSHLSSYGLTMSLSPMSKSLCCGYGLLSLSLTSPMSLCGCDPMSSLLLGLMMSHETMSCLLYLCLTMSREMVS